MQPPPARKGPYLKTLKHVHTEQVARLQAKNQHECDLLEDIRNFTKQRSVIEKTYAEALLKISSAYLNKKIPSIPDLRDEDGVEQWNVWNVWRTVLEENEKLGRARLAAVEVFQQQITDDAKTIRQAKLQASRKCLDQLQVVQKELQGTVSELDRHKKFYFEEEHMAHDARVKLTDAEEKLKKKKGSIFSSFTSLQRSSVKFSSKKEACEEKSTGARNEYIMALAQANAHQDRYFTVDMDSCLRTLEGDVYDKLKEYLTVLGRTELLTCSAAQNSFTKIKEQAQMLSRDYNVTCCVQYYPVLKQHIRYHFDACDGDHCRKITSSEQISAEALANEAKNWAEKIGKQVKIIKDNQRKIRQLQDLKDLGNKNDPDDPNGPDLETKIEEAKENIRRAKTEKIKSESVIECFQDAGINVDEWLKDIESLSATGEVFPTLQTSSSSNSLKNEQVFKEQKSIKTRGEAYYDSDSHDTPSFEKVNKEAITQAQVESPEHNEVNIDARIEEEKRRLASLSWEDPTKVDWGDEGTNAFDAPPSPPLDLAQSTHRDSWPHEPSNEPGIYKVVALYSYTAQNPDELSIVENEHLELIGEGDGDGWARARNYKGEEGYVPHNYVEVESSTSALGGLPLQPQISFSSVDYQVGDTAPLSNGYNEGAPAEDFMPEEIPTQNTAPTTVSSGLTTPFINECRGEDGTFCRALYDYEASAPDELSFYEGQIIRILTFTPHDEEDGWWEGEFDGQRGLFPSIVCDECHWDGEPISPQAEENGEEEDDETSESGLNPPQYTPPGVPNDEKTEAKFTEPTPPTPPVVEEIQNNGAGDAREGTKKTSYSYKKTNNFEMELNSDQQQKYQAQFEDEEDESRVIITEPPDMDVQITLTEPDEDDELPVEIDDEGGESGLEVTQIVITAATPMSEEHKIFPGEAVILEEDENEEEEEESVKNEENFFVADFSQMEGEGEKEETPIEKGVKTSSGGGGGEGESSKVTGASLDIEESSGESQSPMTPEELDVHNLAKLETLKESDA